MMEHSNLFYFGALEPLLLLFNSLAPSLVVWFDLQLLVQLYHVGARETTEHICALSGNGFLI